MMQKWRKENRVVLVLSDQTVVHTVYLTIENGVVLIMDDLDGPSD